MGKLDPPLWPDLLNIWHTVTETQAASLAKWDGTEETFRNLLVNLAKFTRNISAAVPENQEQVL